ncbi:MAG TPA: DsbA family protein [Azospirillaceae bacterium]|nr:DsbA family protein [Azospirillaceae bacterium]
MRRLNLRRLVAATTVLLMTTGTVSAQANRAEIERIVREYILANPEIIMEAVEILRERQAKAEQDQARRALAERRTEILNDPNAPVAGNPQGDVTLVEFFDYQCGYCKSVHPTVKDLVAGDGRIRRVYKEFPILGPASVVASRAALAARNQGKYLEMHDALMEARGQMDEALVMRIARSVGLDVERLKRDMQAPDIEQHIQANRALATALGIQGTPAFIIGDQLVPGAADLATLRGLVRQARGS